MRLEQAARAAAAHLKASQRARRKRLDRVDLIRAAIEAARAAGGRDGLEGYCLFLARRHPARFAGLLVPLLSIEAEDEAEGSDPAAVLRTALVTALEAAGGRDGAAGFFVRLARRHPRTFARLIGTLAVLEGKAPILVRKRPLPARKPGEALTLQQAQRFYEEALALADEAPLDEDDEWVYEDELKRYLNGEIVPRRGPQGHPTPVRPRGWAWDRRRSTVFPASR